MKTGTFDRSRRGTRAFPQGPPTYPPTQMALRTRWDLQLLGTLVKTCAPDNKGHAL